MSSFTTRCTSTPGTVIVQNQNGDYFTSSERFLLKSCLNELVDYDVPSSIISELTNKIDWAGSSSDPVTIKVTDKIYSFMEWSNIQEKVLNPKDYGFKKPSTISIGFVSGAAPIPMMMGGPSIGVVGATAMSGIIGPTPSFAVSSCGAYSRKSAAVAVPTPRIVIASSRKSSASCSRKSSSKSSDYFHDVLSWREAKSKIGYEHRHRQFHEWCKKKGWNFSFSDDSASIPGRYVIEFNKNKWTLKKKDTRRDCVDMLPSM